MQENKVLLTWEAVYDVTDITDYIETKFGLGRADQFQKEMEKQIDGLKFFADAYKSTNIYYRNYCIYKKPFSPSIIFYIIKEREIHVLRVLREDRDWERILTKHQEYTYPH